MRKRLLAGLLALMMLASLMPMTVLAEGETGTTSPVPTETVSPTPTPTVTPTRTPAVTHTPTPNPNATGADVKTGDDSHAGLWGGVALVSAVAFVTTVAVVRRRTEEN